jgi:hypothetical protein
MNTKKSIFKGIIVLVLMASIALFNTASFAQSLQDDIPGVDKPPLRMTGGQHIMMHDDEIVGFLTPPEVDFAEATLRGWMFYPDGSLNLATHDLDMGVDLNMTYDYFGLTATATGRIHTTDNDEIFVCYVSNDSDHYIRIAGYDPATGTHFVSDNQLGSVSSPNPDSMYLGRYIDCAISDINGNGRDELVIAYHGQDGHPELLIANKGWDTRAFNAYARYLETDFTLTDDKSLAVTTGDFDGDGDDEIALAVESDESDGTYLAVYDVEDGSIVKKHSLLVPASFNSLVNRLDIASGDMDGDGNDEIVATTYYHRIDLIDVNATTLEMTLIEYVENTHSVFFNSIATGDLDGDGDDEVVVAFQAHSFDNIFDQIGLNVFDFDNNLGMTKTYGEYVVSDLRKNGQSAAPMGFDVVMGNFDAKIDETQIGDIGKEVALVYRTSDEEGSFTEPATHYGEFRIQIYDVTDDLGLTKKKEETIVQNYTLDPSGQYGSQKVVVAAGDFDGDNVVLGEPDHWVIEGHRDFSALIAEPPKHIDYIKDNTGSLCELNLSRKGGIPGSEPSFYTEYENETGLDVKTTDKSGTDYDWGVETEVEVEKDFGIPVIGAVKTKIEASAGYDYSNNQEKWNNSYNSITVGTDLKAVNDDYLVYRTKDIHIWRYPVIGETQVPTKPVEDDKKGQLYVQLTIPSDITTKSIEGRVVEWYQPVHENGNIFSYPWDKDQIENLGEIKTDPKTYATGDNELTFSVTWKNVTEDGLEVSTEKKVNVDASISVGGEILNAETQVTVKGHYDKTWSSLTSSETTNTKSNGITIFKPSLDVDYAYEFSPFIFENSKLGVLQVDYTVNTSGLSSSKWWSDSDKSGYGEKPDLALNLPYRWTSLNNVDWEFNESSYNLQMMKGLFFLDSDGKPFGYSIEEGEHVTVQVRVYNYSFVDVVDEVEVKIEAQEKTGDTWGHRFEVGTATIPSIEGSSIKGFMSSSASPPEPNWEYASVTFDTTGRADKYYRFWVTVDPSLWVTVDPGNKIQEITGHDTGDKYANNEGYFGIPLYVTAQSGSTESIPEGDLFHEVIAISNDTPVKGEEVMISATVSTLERDFRHVSVCFYDGDPDEGGELFDIELIPYIVAGGSYTVSVPYKTYGKVGIHEIYVVIDRKIGEHTYTNNTAMSLLTLTVVIDGCDSEVANILLPTGCSLSDEIAMCAANAENHGKFVSCVSHMTNDLKKDGIITGKEKSAIQSCAAQANIP